VYESDSTRSIASALAKGIEHQGHSVDLIHAVTDQGKIISIYDFIAVGCTPTSFFGGKISPSIEAFLKTAGSLGSKRSFAFMVKKGLRRYKTLHALMHVMEKQGMFLTLSDIISHQSHAQHIGKTLHIS